MIDTDIVLYQAEWCWYCARVREVLTELLLDYKVVNVPTEHERRTVVKELFGTTGIPSMTDGETKIADDDDAIIAYLRERYGGRRSSGIPNA
jgi:glutaredoxin 3